VEDRALYQAILGLTVPWDVVRVELREAEQTVQVFVEATPGTPFACPDCGTTAPAYDHAERRWRHLDTCQFTTLLVARVPRVQCPTHGVKTVRVPWAEKGSRFTLLFERLAIAWLKEATPTAVSRRLGLTWDEARGIQERAVRRGLARRTREPVARIGIDEKSFLKRHQYVTIVVDLDEPRVLHVADDRRADSLVPYFQGLSEAERTGIEAIAMDMWDPYRKTVREQVPNGERKIVFDKFHVLQHVGIAVDHVRRAESRTLAAEGDGTLKRTKYVWLKNPANFTKAAWDDFAALRDSTLQSARAWAIKESLRPLWDYTYVGAARTFFKRWYWWATHSRLAPVIKVARMLKAHLENILTYLTHRITNAVTEGLNAKIQWIKFGARGCRNRESFKTAILFHCGGLDLEPRLA
jgi:transposase